jgi:hypothetical protein
MAIMAEAFKREVLGKESDEHKRMVNIVRQIQVLEGLFCVPNTDALFFSIFS